MKLKIVLLMCVLVSGTANASVCPDLFNFEMKRLRSEEVVDFCESFQGKPVLAVNTASNCGFTPQFEGLEKLHQKYRDKGLVVIGFPSDSFNQEFDDEKKTAQVCYINYGVSFQMFSTSPVTGENANQFFQKLTQLTEVAPKWNFYKYLIDTDGKTVSVYSNITTPAQLEKEIDKIIERGE